MFQSRECGGARHWLVGVAGAVVVGLTPAAANAQSMVDKTPVTYAAADIFSAIIADDFALLEPSEGWESSALAYAKSQRSRTAEPARWLTRPMPAVDGINGKIDGYGGGASHTRGFYGTNGSLSIPLAPQYGLQIDGGVGSFNNSGTSRGAGHLFWRDPSVGLLGVYGSYSHWNGIGSAIIPRTSVNIGCFAAEGEYYWGRWTFGGLAGYETVRVNFPVAPGLPTFSVPNRFFDAISASYYVTDDLKLSIGHLYTAGRNALALGGEYGVAVGGGRMASLFAQGTLGENGIYAAQAGIRVYFGQREKTLINRNRQDDPPVYPELDRAAFFLINEKLSAKIEEGVVTFVEDDPNSLGERLRRQLSEAKRAEELRAAGGIVE
jgi:hypothetical protein